jgi:hypothetical protein
LKPEELAEAHPGPQRAEQQRKVARIRVPRGPEEPRLLLVGGERIDAARWSPRSRRKRPILAAGFGSWSPASGCNHWNLTGNG